ncbi:hypothetical protein LMH87_007394 [Akanthomyces muscarius]|uniref:Zn(2)-C6 fungal-type domain-containing protein n=1 Tax=Akanthomyces muscarius TaxID=2231603 RepID=A0A9W8USD8_AKAMU|nr:hypothetical protein LMH87_007394 [Akanthomyces muscarius]KAJ4165776.1 hypothetical protein LMH87_007394 [Akanthomyces muscarius]
MQLHRGWSAHVYRAVTTPFLPRTRPSDALMTPTATTSSTSSSSDPGTSSGYATSNEGPGPGGLEDGVGTELTKKGTVRQKRWTTRGRTGCLTCRSRHIKCDEAKPSCRRCISGRRECRGYDFGSPDAVPIGFRDGSGEYAEGDDQVTRDQIQDAVARRRCIVEPEPPDWECMEAARYYCVVVLPSSDEQIMTPFVGLPPCHGPNRPIFLLDVSSRRIADASKARGKLVRAGEEDPQLDGAWAVHSRQMVQILDIVNKGIADKKMQLSTKQTVLRRIFTLLMFDLIVDASAWRPHLLGYLALIQHMGGVRAVMRLKNAHANNTQWTVLLMAIAANSTSPSDQQIRGFEAYTDKDVEFLFSRDVNPDLPCPAPLFVVLKNLTQLRGRIADGSCPKAVLERTTAWDDCFDEPVPPLA